MECKEVQKNIHSFIDDQLDSKESLAFIEHIKKCPNCKEELSIEFLVVTGLQRLDDAEAFDLQRELEDKIKTNEENALRRKKMSRIGFWLLIFIAVIAGYYVSMLFYM
ncbi:MAG: zf-HC2 domain-containing protein [Lachnospiraceae bacterium]|nr:zf-HC2 domain-containing protein [Lachnospiraceae bacterium]